MWRGFQLLYSLHIEKLVQIPVLQSETAVCSTIQEGCFSNIINNLVFIHCPYKSKESYYGEIFTNAALMLPCKHHIYEAKHSILFGFSIYRQASGNACLTKTSNRY